MTEIHEAEKGVVWDDMAYTYDPALIEAEMRRQKMPLERQIDLLEKCLEIYAIDRFDLFEEVERMMRQRMALLRKMQDLREEKKALFDRCGIQSLPDATRREAAISLPQKPLAEENEAPEAKTPSIGSSSQDTKRETVEIIDDFMLPVSGFMIASSTVTAEEVQLLQSLLMQNGLLAMLPNHKLGDRKSNYPLLSLFGVRGYKRLNPTPMMWLGRNNQLHYLIATLYQKNIITCDYDKKWETAARLFVDKKGQPFTAKALNNTGKVLPRDAEHVRKCIPAKWLK